MSVFPFFFSSLFPFVISSSELVNDIFYLCVMISEEIVYDIHVNLSPIRHQPRSMAQNTMWRVYHTI